MNSPFTHRRPPPYAECLLACFVAAVGGAALADGGEPRTAELPPAAGEVDYRRDVQPIFARACTACHGSQKQKGGLRLDSGAEALKGGNSGPAIKTGDGARSRLLHLVAGTDPDLRMPPKGPALSTAEVATLRAWIEQGARIPVNESAHPLPPGTNHSQKHWAFQPVRRPALPPVRQTSWVRNGIDAFVLARLETENATPAPEADRATLARRLSLDLLGLPPTPGEVAEFVSDNRPDAYARLVDRLLASPHYGERWGRHWLDAARFADSDGFEKDTGRPFAWRYRQWVIDALNRGLPFDEFTVEQLAGDLLPGATTEQKVATGFHRNTLTNKEGGVDPEQFRVEQVVDRVNTTARVFLGVTVGCAQCHDHKYDPFSQREYYQLFAFFNADVEVDIPAPVAGVPGPPPREVAAYKRKLAELTAALAAYEKDRLPDLQAKWECGLGLAQLRTVPHDVAAVLLTDPAGRTAAQRKQLTAFFARSDKKFTQLQKAIAAHRKTEPQPVKAQTLAMGAPRRTKVMIRGDFLRPGVEVEPGTPGVLPALNAAGPPSGRLGAKPTRLDLARWIVSPDNPLAARVTANWVWHKYFGRGLVATLEDFGTQGERPSHPELLDWLADEFVRQHWSLKQLHRLIVTSATYRQASHARPEFAARDPLNVLLARQNRLRLEAEVIRDVALAASGLLTKTIGGPSVRPPQPPGISELSYASSLHWVESKGPDRFRRGLYTWFQRTSPYPMLMTFDAPDSNVCCVRRERSNTPLQALTLLNDPVFVECAQALAKRMAGSPANPRAQRLRDAFRLCLGREPSAPEMGRLGRLFTEARAVCDTSHEAAAKLTGGAAPAGVDPAEVAAWVVLARAVMNLDEFVTRE